MQMVIGEGLIPTAGAVLQIFNGFKFNGQKISRNN
jgi:hypothetical protein